MFLILSFFYCGFSFIVFSLTFNSIFLFFLCRVFRLFSPAAFHPHFIVLHRGMKLKMRYTLTLPQKCISLPPGKRWKLSLLQGFLPLKLFAPIIILFLCLMLFTLSASVPAVIYSHSRRPAPVLTVFTPHVTAFCLIYPFCHTSHPRLTCEIPQQGSQTLHYHVACHPSV